MSMKLSWCSESAWLVALCLLAALWLPLPAAAQAGNAVVKWIGPDGEPLQLTSHEQVCDFLRTAAVVSSAEIPTGISKPRKLLLEEDGVRLHAISARLTSGPSTAGYDLITSSCSVTAMPMRLRPTG
jgi:hypothetical protein